MNLKQIAEELDLEILAAGNRLDMEAGFGYTSDLLSDVMANSREGDLWITLQIHLNIIAVAKLKELAGIILVHGRKPDAETLKKAEEEHLPVFVTKNSAFVVSGRLYALLRGRP